MSGRTLRTAVIGATGAVGREMLGCLDRSFLEVGTPRAFSAARSAGKELAFGGAILRSEAWDEQACDDLIAAGIDLVLLAAGAEVARAYGKRLADAGALVVDNSAAFRADESVPLIVAGVNDAALDGHRGVVANPNCSTIIALSVLGPLDDAFGLNAFVASTYQAASGAGAAGLRELQHNQAARVRGEEPRVEVFPFDLAGNVIPLIGDLDAAGDSAEELKMRHESRRILARPGLHVSCTAVRVPVERAHAIALTAFFDRDPSPSQARAVLEQQPDLRLTDAPPTPLAAAGEEEVLVGRIRRAFEDRPGLAAFVVADQLLRGAALNAVRIAERALAAG